MCLHHSSIIREMWVLLLLSHSGISDALRPSATVARQAPPSTGFPRQEYWSGLSFPSPGDLPQPRNWTHVSCSGRRILYHWVTREAHRDVIYMVDWFFSQSFLPYILPARFLQASGLLTTALEDCFVKLSCTMSVSPLDGAHLALLTSLQAAVTQCSDAILTTLELLWRHTFYMINRENTFFEYFLGLNVTPAKFSTVTCKL